MRLLQSGIVILMLVACKASGELLGVTDEEYATQPPVFHFDDYDTCMMLKKKLYCYVNFELKPTNREKPSPVWNTIEKVSSKKIHYRHDLLRHFICVPTTCPKITVLNETDPKFKMEVGACLSEKYQYLGLKGEVTEIACKTSIYTHQTDHVDYIVLGILVTYMLWVTFASLYDLCKRYDTPENYKTFATSSAGTMITAFSVPSNWTKLKSENKSPAAEKLKCVQGIRVYMTFLVILVHTLLSVTGSPIANTKFIEEANDRKDLLGEFSKRGVYILSFHFMMSTWMLIVSMLARADRKEPLTIDFIVKSIIKRYVRLISVLLVIIGLFATWFRQLPYGPLWIGPCEEAERCRQNWWTNVLFIQTWVNRYYMCHIVSWYIGVEMQFYIISLVLITLLIKMGRSKIPYVICVLLILSILGAFWDHYRHGYPSSLAANPEDVYRLQFNKQPQWHDHFSSFIGNFSGSLLGILFGYILYMYGRQRIFTSSIHEYIWWVLSVGTLTVVASLPFFVDVDRSPATSALWVALTRPLFAFGIGILILGMSEGLGGINIINASSRFRKNYLLAKAVFV
ncbi:unnamed protein product [Acanthoscelides obtectus]|uniref:Acyltransferase 3 domain-containing protein n=1 Tax=Acanthoscelides obtectus TaxID=200917 RepID=A0A9P0JRU8_ACAOB|nr:unnamed protein product [Acanthoscelides obtectus]CAK1679303.1 Nose resistant to fluoxetine protein 6 [Acanthoscelides obtectus]